MVGLRRGGLLETVIDGETGFLVDGYEPGRYAAVLAGVDELDPGRVQAHAWKYSVDVFNTRMAAWITEQGAWAAD